MLLRMNSTTATALATRLGTKHAALWPNATLESLIEGWLGLDSVIVKNDALLEAYAVAFLAARS